MGAKRFRIYGQVCGTTSKHGLAGLEIRALDKDLCLDDRLGTAITDKKGHFEIHYNRSDFRDFFETRPDIYLRVRAPDGALLYTTEDQVRYQADDTERFQIEIPETEARITDGEALRRRIVEDPALQRELAEEIGGLLSDKHLLHPSLAYTFVPLVAQEAKAEAQLFVDRLGPQPEPPDMPAYNQLGPQPIPPDSEVYHPTHPAFVFGHWVNPQPEPPMPAWLKDILFEAEPDPEPWCVRWWWIGLPEVELLKRLERYRITDRANRMEPAPARTAATFAYRIMSDTTLVQSLSRKIDGVLGRHGVVLATGLNYSFAPVVYARPGFAAEMLAPVAAMPRIIDRSGQTSPPVWVHPLEGVPPAELLSQLADIRGQLANSMEQPS